MRQIVITKVGGPEVLEIQERADMQLNPDSVAIAVKAIGINFADILARKGMYPDGPKLPGIVGYEVSGEIEATGDNVDKTWQGKRVLALTRFNGYSDKLVVPINQVYTIPKDLSFAEAAAIPVNYLTAYQLVVVMGGLKAGESTLIHNAGGGVGLAAINMAKHIGAVTYGTSSKGKHDFLLKRGLDHAIDYRNDDWEKELKNLTEKRGVDLILDPIGGGHWRKSFRSLRATGRLGMFGISSASNNGVFGKLSLLKTVVQMPFFHPISLLNQNKSVFGVNLGTMWHEKNRVSKWMEHICEGVDEGWVRPHVDKVFPFTAAGEAHRYIEERKNIGKVILETETD